MLVNVTVLSVLIIFDTTLFPALPSSEYIASRVAPSILVANKESLVHILCLFSYASRGSFRNPSQFSPIHYLPLHISSLFYI
ncbi:Hypothetical predicted protein [Octopus vulgaris]|uniref:Secreted protein n=1 Tax=Octopus vulgaris TaxID=6645 RepID=A0AA36FBU8_OCTVU|nr:Hypothetical predicted protein [Octopus vulgaris]